jgi:hypothetical protein
MRDGVRNATTIVGTPAVSTPTQYSEYSNDEPLDTI